MTIEIALLISIVSVTSAVFFAIKSNKRADSKEIAERVARDTKLDMKLGEIGNDVKEVKETVRTIQNDVKDHEGRISKLEASCNRLHERIDNFPHKER